ncbi:MAG: hypothetical protein JOZ02_23115 [Acidobacteria bacterium]|nr:hypothetical protein [Acidobacteriota bacterium]
MPVIGRLDGQVDEVIISPISRRRGEAAPPPTPKNEETPGPSDSPDRAPSQTSDVDESSANADELPVWLL